MQVLAAADRNLQGMTQKSSGSGQIFTQPYNSPSQTLHVHYSQREGRKVHVQLAFLVLYILRFALKRRSTAGITINTLAWVLHVDAIAARHAHWRI